MQARWVPIPARYTFRVPLRTSAALVPISLELPRWVPTHSSKGGWGATRGRRDETMGRAKAQRTKPLRMAYATAWDRSRTLILR